METVSVVAELPAPASRIWATLADFGAFLDWAYRDAGGSIEVEGDGIGMIRHLDMGGSRMATSNASQTAEITQTLEGVYAAFSKALAVHANKTIA